LEHVCVQENARLRNAQISSTYSRSQRSKFKFLKIISDVEKEREAELEKIRKEKEEQSALKNKMSSGAKGTVKTILNRLLDNASQFCFLNDQLLLFSYFDHFEKNLLAQLPDLSYLNP